MKFFVALVVVLVSLAAVADASHFRYQTAHYTRSTTNDREITFVLKQAWRRSAFGNPNVGQTFGEYVVQWGDGTTSPVSLTATSISTIDDWVAGEQVLVHTFGGTATSFDVVYETCCRISSLKDGNNDRDQRVVTTVKVGPNSPLMSPQIDSLPIIPFALNQPNNVQLPLLLGSDGGVTPFAVSAVGTSQYGSGLLVAQPNNHGPFSFSSSGVISWTPNLAGLYAFQVFVLSQSGVRVTLDVILNVRQGTVNHNPPVITDPASNAVINFTPGQLVSFPVTAVDPDSLDDVTIQAGSLPPGAQLGPCIQPEPQTTCTSPFSWQTDANSASQLICFFARDLANNMSGQVCVQLVATSTQQPCGGGLCDTKSVGASCTQASHVSAGKCATLDFTGSGC